MKGAPPSKGMPSAAHVDDAGFSKPKGGMPPPKSNFHASAKSQISESNTSTAEWAQQDNAQSKGPGASPKVMGPMGASPPGGQATTGKSQGMPPKQQSWEMAPKSQATSKQQAVADGAGEQSWKAGEQSWDSGSWNKGDSGGSGSWKQDDNRDSKGSWKQDDNRDSQGSWKSESWRAQSWDSKS